MFTLNDLLKQGRAITDQLTSGDIPLIDTEGKEVNLQLALRYSEDEGEPLCEIASVRRKLEGLSKKDIIRLLRGVEISDYKTLFELRDMGLVQYIGGFVDDFEWNSIYSTSWKKYSEEELYELYRKITK